MKTKSKNALFGAGNAINFLVVLCMVFMATVSVFSKEKDASNKNSSLYASVEINISPEYDAAYNIIGFGISANATGIFYNDFTVSGSIGYVDINGLGIGGLSKNYEITIPAGSSSADVYVEMFISPETISSDIAGVKAFVYYRSNMSVMCHSLWSSL